MHWNHRVMRTTTRYETTDDDVTLAIHEVYYDDNDKPHGWTGPTDVMTDNEDGIEGLRQVLQWMLDCLDKPILEYSE